MLLEQRNLNEQCYFCLINIKGINGRNRSKPTYREQLVSHSFEIPVPSFIHLEELHKEYEPSTSARDNTHGQSDSDFEGISSVPLVFSLPEFNRYMRYVMYC